MTAATFDIFDSLPSTQSLCLERLKIGEIGPGWVLAREQTQGVGRHGRAWIGPRGNFMASRFENMAIDIRQVPQIAFVTALAVYETLRPLIADTDDNLRIKWPNDILHKGRKLCGMLVQTEPAEVAGHLGVVIGIGMNLAEAPVVEAYPTVALSDLSHDKLPDPVNLLYKINDHLDDVFNLWREGGFDDIAAAWLKRAYGRDMRLSLMHDGLWVNGDIQGLDPFGALQVRGVDGQIFTITGGDIRYEALDAARH